MCGTSLRREQDKVIRLNDSEVRVETFRPTGPITTKHHEPATSAPTPEQSAPGIGQEVRDGKFGFVVTGVETGVTTLGDNPYLQKDALGQFVLVNVTVTNVSDRSQTYFGSNQKLIDTQGREFENDTMAAINLEAETAIGGDINPGLSRDITIVFDIPVDAVPATLEVHDSMFSGGAEIALR
ncbi:hypothetical protein CH267_22050 [Rhodococcus sp. 06-621-2]|nr:hypothetical protein CH267_22050 [Rhodococcus sp. 06-621-2]